MSMSTRKLRFVLLFLGAAISAQAQPRISEDRDLTDIDLSGWDCLNSLGGSAKTPDGVERNRQKNRSAIDLSQLTIPSLDWPGIHETHRRIRCADERRAAQGYRRGA